LPQVATSGGTATLGRRIIGSVEQGASGGSRCFLAVRRGRMAAVGDQVEQPVKWVVTAVRK